MDGFEDEQRGTNTDIESAMQQTKQGKISGVLRYFGRQIFSKTAFPHTAIQSELYLANNYVRHFIA